VKRLDLLGGVRGDGVGGVQGRGEGGCRREGLQDDDNECWVWRGRMYSPPVKAAPRTRIRTARSKRTCMHVYIETRI